MRTAHTSTRTLTPWARVIDELKEQVEGLVVAVREATAKNKELSIENIRLKGQIYNIDNFIKERFPDLIVGSDTFTNVKSMAITMSQKFMLVMGCNDKAVKELAEEVERLKDADSH